MHLLLVEDDPKLGRLLTRMLQEERHLVELTDSGGTTGATLELASGTVMRTTRLRTPVFSTR